MTVNPDKFRETIGNFTTGVTVVTFPGSPPHGMTANAVSSVSLDPPLLLICVDHDTRSYELLDNGVEGFAVNIMAKDQQDLAEHFAGMMELDEDPFNSQAVQRKSTGSPVFTDSLGYLDCQVHESHIAGDHTIYIGKVLDADVTRQDTEPLTFYKGNWGTVLED